VTPVFSLRRLHKSHQSSVGDVPVFHDLSIDFGAELTAIVGKSGVGKSTVLSIMGGLDVPDFGAIWFRGEPVEWGDPRALETHRRRVAFVFQELNLLPMLSVLENTALPLLCRRPIRVAPAREGSPSGGGTDGNWNGNDLWTRVHSISAMILRRAAVRLRSIAYRRDSWREYALSVACKKLEVVGMRAFGKRRPRDLSHGEQQRVAVARAFASGASVILADEPTGSLDETNAEIVLKAFRDLAHISGIPVIIVTHDMPRARLYCDRVLELRAGRIEEVRRGAPSSCVPSPAPETEQPQSPARPTDAERDRVKDRAPASAPVEWRAIEGFVKVVSGMSGASDDLEFVLRVADDGPETATRSPRSNLPDALGGRDATNRSRDRGERGERGRP
jgi:putative ABC transport system ATP-binding protein